MDELLKQLATADQRVNELLAGDTLTAEQQAEHDKLVGPDGNGGDRAAIVAKIKRKQAQAAREAEAAELARNANEQSVAQRRAERTVVTGRLTDADRPTQNRSLETPAETPIFAEPRRYGSVRNFRGTRFGMSAEQRALRFGLWAAACIAQDIPRFGRSNNFLGIQRAYANELRQITERNPGFDNAASRQATAVGSNDASGYQYLIPVEFSTDIIDLREEFGVARRLFKLEPMVSDTKRVPRRRGGLTAYWTTENNTLTESNKIWDDVELVAKDLTALSRASNQVDADSIVNWGDDLAREIAYAFAYAEDNAAFNGDGTSTYGRIIGVRQKLLLVDGTNASVGLVTGTGSGWTGLVMGDFEKVIGTLPNFADTTRARWTCHRTFFYTVMQPLQTALGGVTMREAADPPYGGAQGRSIPLFLGYPVEFSQVFPSASESGKVEVTLGDYASGAFFGQRQEPQIMFSEHASVGGQSVFERNQIAIRGVERVDINVHDVGFATSNVQAASPGPIVGLKCG